MTGTGDDKVSRDTMSAVRAARARAADAPTADEIARLLTKAARQRSDMSIDDIKSLGAAAIRQAQRLNFLLGKLNGLLEEPGGDE